jgi:sulfate adenylyltransferase
MSDHDGLNPPHGGTLVDLYVPDAEATDFAREASELPALTVSAVERCDLELLAGGGFSPLTGFQNEADYLSVIDSTRLANGLVWSIPITLAISDERARGLSAGRAVALRDAGGELLGTLLVEDVYRAAPEREAESVYGTTDPQHPGVARLLATPLWRVGGPVQALRQTAPHPFTCTTRTPRETRAAFTERGWRTIVGFQTRNPVHRAHEYIQKVALETVDGLLLHPLVGETKADDIPADVRLRCYQVLIEYYYPRERVLLATLPAAMRYAGPREAIHHALMRKNFGCSHFIVGRDHAGVGSYYGTYDAQAIFSTFQPGEIGIQPLFFENTFYCRACGSMASSKTCPHGVEQHVTLSGTKVRELLAAGQSPPPEFSRAEVAAVLLGGALG